MTGRPQAQTYLLPLVSGVALTMLQMTMLDVVTDDVIQAIDTDRYRFHWALGSYILGGAPGWR